MRVRHRSSVLVVAMLCAGLVRAQEPTTPQLSPEEMEEFLLNAELSNVEVVGVGVTDSRRASASYGPITHDVHIQTVDVSRSGIIIGGRAELLFRDAYNYNVAAYRLAALLGMDNVPMSVLRSVRGRRAAVTWWVDDVALTEQERFRQGTLGPNPARTYDQFYTMYVFDELIQNRDRNRGNMLWTRDWKMWLIDHTRAFRPDIELTEPERLTRVSRDLLENLRRLTPEALETATADTLTRPQRESILARRDLLVRHFDERVARFGHGAVLID